MEETKRAHGILVRIMHRWQDNIKMDLTETEYKGVHAWKK
jgi:hypothetical protein